MNLLTFSIETLQSITKYDEQVNTEPLEAQIRFADIWDDCHMKIKERYNLPLLSLTGEGFEMGSASVTDCIYIAKVARKETGLPIYFNPSYDGLQIFWFLDQEFINLIKPEVNKLIKEYDLYCSQYLNRLKIA